MLKITTVLADASPARADDTLTLPFERRQKSRLVARLDGGREVALQLPRGQILRDGARLQAEDGSVIGVRSAPEALSLVESTDPTALLRAAYHLGNRHVALQIEPGAISYLHDHVLDEMVLGLGLTPRVVERRFEPEAGAYGRSGGHPPHHHHPASDHEHHHNGPHDHDHDHDGHGHEH
jgi:urease accessory protein